MFEVNDKLQLESQLETSFINKTNPFQGHDTTSAAVAWSVFLLGHHPNIQKRVQEEVDNVLGNKK